MLIRQPTARLFAVPLFLLYLGRVFVADARVRGNEAHAALTLGIVWGVCFGLTAGALMWWRRR